MNHPVSPRKERRHEEAGADPRFAQRARPSGRPRPGVLCAAGRAGRRGRSHGGLEASEEDHARGGEEGEGGHQRAVQEDGAGGPEGRARHRRRARRLPGADADRHQGRRRGRRPLGRAAVARDDDAVLRAADEGHAHDAQPEGLPRHRGARQRRRRLDHDDGQEEDVGSQQHAPRPQGGGVEDQGDGRGRLGRHAHARAARRGREGNAGRDDGSGRAAAGPRGCDASRRDPARGEGNAAHHEVSSEVERGGTGRAAHARSRGAARSRASGRAAHEVHELRRAVDDHADAGREDLEALVAVERVVLA
ncbi:LigA [Anaeromyxobacter sp. Fw109-5]|nr:LigA [Anaeromyxobacter sp. Fw109-5]